MKVSQRSTWSLDNTDFVGAGVISVPSSAPHPYQIYSGINSRVAASVCQSVGGHLVGFDVVVVRFDFLEMDGLRKIILAKVVCGFSEL